MTLRELVVKFRKEHGISQRQFANLCDLSNGYISMLERNINPSTGLPLIPSLPSINKIAQGMGMTVHELLSQAEDMPVELLSAGEAEAQLTKEPNIIPTSLPSNILPMPQFVKKPRLGTIACGKPILAVEDAEEFDMVPIDVKCDFTLRCKGDSMINARIFDGDIVYIRSQPEVENGEIAAVRIGDEATLKKVYFTPGSDRITLRACNPMYPDMEYEGDALNDIEILGKATAFTSIISR